jgi:AcrR family transcriptional regulator
MVRRVDRARRHSGRAAQAARNDQAILAAARAIFVADPTAPIAAVAERAGVGISALYRRYPSKDDLLRTLCLNGQRTYLAIVRKAAADSRDPGIVYETFLREVVAADTHALTSRLAGLFTPSAENFRLAGEMDGLTVAVFERAQRAGAIRPDVGVWDVSHLFELFSWLKLGDPARTDELRQRYLTLLIDGLRTRSPSPLPGASVRVEELTERWLPAVGAGAALASPS